jgi:hypothetical protein
MRAWGAVARVVGVVCCLVAPTALIVSGSSSAAAVGKPTLEKANDADHDGTFSATESVPAGAAYPWTVTYQLTIWGGTAPGPLGPFHHIASLTDDMTSDLGTCQALAGTDIANGDTKTCTYTVTLTGPGAAALVNTAELRIDSGKDVMTAQSTVNFPPPCGSPTNTESVQAATTPCGPPPPPPAGQAPPPPPQGVTPQAGTTPPVTSAVAATPPPPPVQQVAVAGIFQLPSPKTCISRRSFGIRLRAPAGETLIEGEVFVNGKQAAVVRGARLRSTVDLKGLPKGRYTVLISVKTTSGKRYEGARHYRTCAPKLAGGVPKL